MKMIMFTVLLCSCIFSGSAYTSNNEYKIYLSDETIELTDNAIFVKVDGQVFVTDALYEDKEGYYILDVIHITEHCANCGEFAMVDGKCLNCGYRKKRR